MSNKNVFEEVAARLRVLRKTEGVKRKATKLGATPRSIEIVTLLAEGLSTLAIAERMGLSINTIRNNIFDATVSSNTRNVVHLVSFYLREKIIK